MELTLSSSMKIAPVRLAVHARMYASHLMRQRTNKIFAGNILNTVHASRAHQQGDCRKQDNPPHGRCKCLLHSSRYPTLSISTCVSTAL